MTQRTTRARTTWLRDPLPSLSAQNLHRLFPRGGPRTAAARRTPPGAAEHRHGCWAGRGVCFCGREWPPCSPTHGHFRPHPCASFETVLPATPRTPAAVPRRVCGAERRNACRGCPSCAWRGSQAPFSSISARAHHAHPARPAQPTRLARHARHPRGGSPPCLRCRATQRMQGVPPPPHAPLTHTHTTRRRHHDGAKSRSQAVTADTGDPGPAVGCSPRRGAAKTGGAPPCTGITHTHTTHTHTHMTHSHDRSDTSTPNSFAFEGSRPACV